MVSESEIPAPESSPVTPPSEPTAEQPTTEETSPTADVGAAPSAESAETAPAEPPAPPGQPTPAEPPAPAGPDAAEAPSRPATADAPPVPKPRPAAPGPHPGAPTPAALARKNANAALRPVAQQVTVYDPDQLAAATAFGSVSEDGTVTVQDGTQVRTIGTTTETDREAALEPFARGYL